MSDLTHIRETLRRLSVGRDVVADALARVEAEWSCDHPTTEMRVKTDTRGRPMYAEQCVRCGARPGPWVSAKTIADPSNVPPMDEGLSDDWSRARWDARVRAQEAARDERSREWWRAYESYLSSAEWHRKRQRVLQRASGICEGCLEARAVHVHHTTYDHVGDELLWELRAVCRACHEKVHPHMREGGAA